MGKGYESLMGKVKKDCNEGQGCFNPNGCNFEFYKYEDDRCKINSKCGHKYCDKFKWIINRAKHYAEKTGLDWEDILDSWEEDCNYWYMNYYQDCNQPLIKEDKVKIFETIQDMNNSIPEHKFRCPCCGGVSSNPYECNSGLEVSKATKKKTAKICDWKVYGLFQDLGKGTYVYCKDKMKGETIFTPLSWEKEIEGEKK